MNLDLCPGCGRPVLGIGGQFSMLDSYYTSYLPEASRDANLFGCWHAACFHKEPLRGNWQQAILSNYTEVRGYEVVAELDSGVVLFLPQHGERVVVSPDAVVLDLSFDGGIQRRVPGGVVCRTLPSECSLQLDDEEVVARLQEQLRTQKKVPLMQVFELLGTADCVLHPEALTDSYFVWHKGLARLWEKQWVTANLDYGVFVPEELEPYLTRRKPRA